MFAVFMGKSKIKGSKVDKSDKEVEGEIEQRCVSLISNMCLVSWGWWWRMGEGCRD